MKRSRSNRSSSRSRWLAFLLGVVVVRFIAGCASTNDENLSERPWNTPKSWETGLPTGMLEGRR